MSLRVHIPVTRSCRSWRQQAPWLGTPHNETLASLPTSREHVHSNPKGVILPSLHRILAKNGKLAHSKCMIPSRSLPNMASDRLYCQGLDGIRRADSSNPANFYTDTFFPSHKSLDGNTLVQVCCNDSLYIAVYPMRSKQLAGHLLREFIQDYGIPSETLANR